MIFTLHNQIALTLNVLSTYFQLVLKLLHELSRCVVLGIEMSNFLMQEVHGYLQTFWKAMNRMQQGRKARQTMTNFVLGLLAYIIGLGMATLPTLHKLDFLPKSHSISLFVETSNDSPTWEKG